MISVGDEIPSVTLKRLGSDGMEDVQTDDIFAKGRKVALFGVPGAFTPACSNEHLPGYVEKADDIFAKGVDEIVCVAVNDPFVMKQWGEQSGADGKVTMLPDGNAELTRAMGLDVDLSAPGLGTRCKRFAALVEDGKVTSIEVEPGKAVDVSSAGACLARLSQ